MIMNLMNKENNFEVTIEINRTKFVSVSESTDTTIVNEYEIQLTNQLKKELKECQNVEDYELFLNLNEVRKIK